MGDSSGNSSVWLSMGVQSFLIFVVWSVSNVFFAVFFLYIYNCFRFFLIVTQHISVIAVTRKRSKCNELECEELPIRRDTVELNTLKDREDESLKTEDESLRRSLLSNSNE